MKKEEFKTIINSYGYVKTYEKKISLILLMVIVNLLLNIVQPILWGYLLEAVIKLDTDKFVGLISSLLGLYIFEALFQYLQLYLSTYVNESITFDMKNKVFSKIMNFKMILIKKMGVGDVLSHLENDVEVIVNVYTGQLLNVIVGVLKALIVGVFAFIVSWPLALVIVLMLPLNYLIFNKYGKLLQSAQVDVRKNLDKYYSGTQEYVAGVESIKRLGAKKYVIERFKKLIKENKFLGIKIGKLVAGSSGLSGLINFITQILVYVIGIYLIINGKLTFALFVAFSAYTVLLSDSLLEITRINPVLQQAVVSIDRVNKILSEFEDNQEHWGEKSIEIVKSNIIFENVSFGYDHMLFNKLNLKFEKNKKYAIVGLSGAGKSSLFSLLLRMYDLNDGRILIDDVDIREITEKCYRNMIGVIPQEPILFNLSIMENIKIGHCNVTDDQVYNVAKLTNIDADIRKMKDGYNTVISSIGDNLSVGQKQRIALSRTLLKNPQIILFDEPTSALDNISIELVNETINTLSKKHIVIIISHNISSILDADEIIVMDSGKIVGIGKHSDLVCNCIYYKKLFDKENNR